MYLCTRSICVHVWVGEYTSTTAAAPPSELPAASLRVNASLFHFFTEIIAQPTACSGTGPGQRTNARAQPERINMAPQVDTRRPPRAETKNSIAMRQPHRARDSFLLTSAHVAASLPIPKAPAHLRAVRPGGPRR